MKIFAKRKKKAASAGANPQTTPERSTFASDPIVEELLKKDPKEWNSKERRMIKRYQDRKNESEQSKSGSTGETQSTETDEKETAAKSAGKGIGKDNVEVENNESGHDSSESENSSGSDDNDDDSSSDGVGKEKPKDKLPVSLAESNARKDLSKQTSCERWTDDAEVDDTKDEENIDGTIDPKHEVYKLLDKLNSKMKRTLSRKLEREGATALDEVQSEAAKILGGPSEDKESKKREVESSEKDSDAAGPSKKKRKKEVDWSNLPPEERLRREEQRKKQIEAAERRVRGEDKTPGYKHPLNSERRRANKRKPKWKNGSSTSGTSPPVKNDHDHSGFLHRKQKINH